MMDVNESQRYWAEEAEEDYQFDTYLAYLVMREFPDCERIDRVCNTFDLGRGVIYGYRIECYGGAGDDWTLEIFDAEDRVVWATMVQI